MKSFTMRPFLRALFTRAFHRRNITVFSLALLAIFLLILIRIVCFDLFEAQYYATRADQLHERERSIKAKRGRILDRNGIVLADCEAVCTVSVIHNQITNPEAVIRLLCDSLELTEEYVRKRVEKRSSMEYIKKNVPREIGELIRAKKLDGIKVDEDYKRVYKNGTIASKVLGFTGADNQGIIGLEVTYDSLLQGIPGTIYSTTDAKGVDIETVGERRQEPVDGTDLVISMDWNIQSFCMQLAQKVMDEKQALEVTILVMNPQNGELYAMAQVPAFDSNHPYELGIQTEDMTQQQKQEQLNRLWRNGAVSDTYEPGSTFKTVTAAIGLETGAVQMEDTFFCPGYVIVDDRRIRCHKTKGHGTQDFLHATMNSCNPSFVTFGLRIGVSQYYDYFCRFGLKKKTGIDLPGEASTIMHKEEKIGNVELATISFGQSFQITPIQLITTISAFINGGNRITPHFAMEAVTTKGERQLFGFPVESGIVSEHTSALMREILEQVVAAGGGSKGQVEGVRVGGKTATSEKLPRGTGKYIASFVGFAPADDPKVIAMAIINEPQGTYYGGQIAAPVVRTLFENILPYLGILEYNK